MFFSAMILAIGSMVPVQEPQPWHVRNLGLAGGLTPFSNARFTLFLASEDQEQQDWNGDGDQVDLVYHVYDGKKREVRSLGMASQSWLFGQFREIQGTVFGLPVWEASQGDKDLNGDGDTLDLVMFSCDVETGKAINTGVAVSTGAQSTFAVHEGVIAFLAEEASQGARDLNGDGTLLDLVLHLHRFEDDLLINTAMSVVLFESRGPIAGGWTREERVEDYNSDGDREDSIPFVIDMAELSTVLLPIASTAGLFEPQLLPLGHFSFRADERGDGRDWNGDGDLVDYVPFYFDHGTKSLRNVGVAGNFSGRIESSEQRFGLIDVSEAQQQADFDGDGLLQNDVLHLLDLESGHLANLGFDVYEARISGNWIGFTVQERRRFGSLNDDLDVRDRVFHIYDILTGEVQNIGLALDAGIESRSGSFLLRVSEYDQGGQDRNGDGDGFDPVLALYRPRPDDLQNLSLSGSGFFDDQLLFIGVGEQSQSSMDLNHDGDTADTVLHYYNLETGDASNLGISALYLDRQQRVFLVREWEEGNQDLNGDGDALDVVLHVLEAGDLGLEKRRGPMPRR